MATVCLIVVLVVIAAVIIWAWTAKVSREDRKNAVMRELLREWEDEEEK